MYQWKAAVAKTEEMVPCHQKKCGPSAALYSALHHYQDSPMIYTAEL